MACRVNKRQTLTALPSKTLADLYFSPPAALPTNRFVTFFLVSCQNTKTQMHVKARLSHLVAMFPIYFFIHDIKQGKRHILKPAVGYERCVRVRVRGRADRWLRVAVLSSSFQEYGR